MTGTIFPYIPKHPCLENFARFLMKPRMSGSCAKTACVIIVTDSAWGTTERISHAPAVLVLEMRHIMVVEILLEWISEKSQNWWKIRKVSSIFEWRGRIPNELSSTAELYSNVGVQTVTSNCSCTSEIHTCQPLVKLKTFANMLLLTQGSVATPASRKRQQFRI